MKKGLQYLNKIEKKVVNSFVKELKEKLGSFFFEQVEKEGITL